MGYWDANPELLQLASTDQGFNESGGQLSAPSGGYYGSGNSGVAGGVDPALMGGNGGYSGQPVGQAHLSAPTTTQAPQAGQFANTQQGALDWATQKYGVDPVRGSGFVNLQAAGGLQNLLSEYTKATGNQAQFLGGPSGDQASYAGGPVSDSATSGGSFWNPGAGGGGATGSGGSYSGGAPAGYGGHLSSPTGTGGSDMPMPSAPTPTSLTAPSPFTYTQSNLGNFQSPSQTPTMGQLSYNPMQAPGHLDSTDLATPAGYTPDKATPLTAEEFKADPGRQFREQQALGAQANIFAHAGALRTGNALQAQGQLASDMASQEYGAADARKKSLVAQNNASGLSGAQFNAGTNLAYNQNTNQNALNFGNANFNQGFQTNQANNQGQNAATQGNNQNALAAQGQGYNQALQGYQANLGAQNQNYNQAIGAYGQNASTQLQYGAQNQNNALATYQAQVNAALGQGNLNLGFQNSNNNYALGQGSLGVQQGQLGLQQQGQQFNQGLQTYQQNYQNQVLDPWNMNLQLANLGNPGAPNGQGNANAQSDLITGSGNANAAAQLQSGQAWGNAVNNLGGMAAGAYGNYQNGLSYPTNVYNPGLGQPPYR